MYVLANNHNDNIHISMYRIPKRFAKRKYLIAMPLVLIGKLFILESKTMHTHHNYINFIHPYIMLRMTITNTAISVNKPASRFALDA